MFNFDVSLEQTGRMNKDVDYRTDFYSMGILFYKILCGKSPFEGTEKEKIMYAHIAKVPPSPSSSALSTMQTYLKVTTIVRLQIMRDRAPRRSSEDGGEVKVEL